MIPHLQTVNYHFCFPSILSQYSTLPRRKRKGIFIIFSSLYSLSQKKGNCCVARFAGIGGGNNKNGFGESGAKAILLLIILSVERCACNEKQVKESNKNIAIVLNILVIIACKFSGDS